MATEITIEVPTEKPLEGETVTVETPADETTTTDVIEAATDILEVAEEIAEKIAAPDVVLQTLGAQSAKLDEVVLLLNGIVSQLADIQATQLADILEDNTEEEVGDVAAIKDLVDEVEEEAAPQEEVPPAITPQIRKKKPTKWI